VLNYQDGWIKGIALYMKYTLLTVSLLNQLSYVFINKYTYYDFTNITEIIQLCV